jgi:hypothetical protein
MFDACDTETRVLPEGLDELSPGPELARILASIDLTELGGYDRILVLRAHQRLSSHYQARVYRDMMAVLGSWEAETEPEDVEHAYAAAEAEIGSALRLTRKAASVDLDFAYGLLSLPAVFSALLSGRIDRRRAGVLVKGLAHLPSETAQALAAEVIERASRSTSGQLWAYLRKRCMEADPNLAKRRYDEAWAERRIELGAGEDGTAHLSAYDLPARGAVAALQRITEIAFALKADHDDRTLDQIRADVFLDLLLGKVVDHASGAGTVDLLVDLATLVGLAEIPGELAGFGPVIADICRQVAAEQVAGEWRFTVTHPDTGLPVANGITRRRPTRGQRRFVEARNRHCVFPGCRMPARSSDLDHRLPYAEGGPTTVANLVPLCRRHHVLRHLAGWKHEPLSSGDHLWTSPLGHRYTTSGRDP